MIRNPQIFLKWALTVFVLYILLTRAVISWVQFFPTQFSSLVNAVSGYSLQFDDLQVSQHWLGFEFTIENIKLSSDSMEFEASTVSADLNTFYYFWPTADYGDFLAVEHGEYRSFESFAPKDQGASATQNLTFSDVIHLDVNLNRLWKKVSINELELKPLDADVCLHLHQFQSLKSSRLTLTSEFSLSYQSMLNQERFNLKSSFEPSLWGGIESGDFSIRSFNPLVIEKFASVLSAKWHDVLPKGELILDIEGKLRNAQLANLNLAINAKALSWKPSSKKLPESLGALLSWSGHQQVKVDNAQNWNFTLSNIQINNRFIDAASPIDVRLEQGSQLYFKADKFDIEPFKLVTKALLKKEFAENVLDKTINLSVSNLSGQLDLNTLELPSLHMNVKHLELPETDYPGINLKDLTIRKFDDQFMISTAQEIEVSSDLVSEKLLKIELPKQLVFKLNADRTAWSLPKASFKVNDVLAELNIKTLNSQYIDAQLNTRFATMATLKSYLPYSIMSKDLQSWLKQGLVAGEDIRASTRIKGKLVDFPFSDGSGVFEIDAKVHKASLNFNPEWPLLTDFDARLDFKPFELQINVDSLNLGEGNKAQNVKVTIPDLDKDDIGLIVTGTVNSQLNQVVNYLTVSPIAEKVGVKKFLESSSGYSGKTLVTINDIWVPISGHENVDPKVNGSVAFDNATLKVLDVFEFNHVNGSMSFDEKKINAPNLTFHTLKGKGALHVSTNSKTKFVELDAKGLAFERQNSWFSQPVSWATRVDIPFGAVHQDGVSLKALFDVGKAKSQLPYPYDSKSLANKKANIDAFISDKSIKAYLNLPDMIKTKLVWDNNQQGYDLKILQTLIGQSAYRQLKFKNKGSYIRGHLGEVDLNRWFELADNVSFKHNAGKSSLEWQRSELNFKKFRYLSSEYKNTKVSWLTQANQPLKVYVKNDGLEASVRFSSSKQIDLNVNHFVLDTKNEKKGEEKRKDELQSCKVASDQGSMPTINFNGKNIYIDGRKINKLKFAIKDHADKLSFESIEGSFGDGAGQISGNYVYNKSANKSALTANLTSDKVESLTEFMDIDKGFTGKFGEVKLTLNWLGGVQCFNTHIANGAINFNLREGSIEDVEPGIARLIGLLSVDSLIRRLKLDLKDVTNKGLVYDSIRGKATLSNDIVTLQKMKLKAPSADAYLNGTIDIKREAFDLHASLTPKVGSTLPTVAAIAGGVNPLTALAVYTVMKVIPGINENLITYQYSVTGKWDSPIIKENTTQKTPENKEKTNQIEDILNLE